MSSPRQSVDIQSKGSRRSYTVEESQTQMKKTKSKHVDKITQVEECGCEKETETSPEGSQEDLKGTKANPINTEFLYYSATLKEIAPKLSEEQDRQKIIPWIKKMFRPEYQAAMFQEKRNRYLMFMTLSVLNDETYNILRKPPPTGAIPDISTLPEIDIVKAEWEVDSTWRDILCDVPEEQRDMPCSIHKDSRECNLDHHLDKILDEEYTFLLYLARPYSILLKNAEVKAKVQAWFEALCKIHGDSCSTMRGIRNDYMMALLGYIQELRLAGPFVEFPSIDAGLLPLPETAKLTAVHQPVLDPTSNDVSDFLSDQPIPDEGAFCYIAVTGDLCLIQQDANKQGAKEDKAHL